MDPSLRTIGNLDIHVKLDYLYEKETVKNVFIAAHTGTFTDALISSTLN